MIHPIKDINGLSPWSKAFLPIAVVLITTISYGWGSTWWEILSAVSGVFCVVLVAEGKLSNFGWGFINCALYGLTSYNNNFFGDMALNWAIYLPFQVIGFMMWRKAMPDGKTVEMYKMNHGKLFIVAICAAVAIFICGRILENFNGQHPYTDSSNVVLSLLATALMALRFREQWACWILVNLTGIWMWANAADSSGPAELMMWAMFLLNSGYGLLRWSKENNSMVM